MAERFRSNVQRNAQILAEELRQSSGPAAPTLCLGLDIFGNASRLRNHDTIRLKSVDMEPDRLANLVLERRNGIAGSDAASRSGT
jgi:hypothetical protein